MNNLSEEEKKAIEIQDSISILENTDLNINNIYSIDLRTYNFAVKTVLNLIEELKIRNTIQDTCRFLEQRYVLEQFVSKYKIREIIEGDYTDIEIILEIKKLLEE